MDCSCLIVAPIYSPAIAIAIASTVVVVPFQYGRSCCGCHQDGPFLHHEKNNPRLDLDLDLDLDDDLADDYVFVVSKMECEAEMATRRTIEKMMKKKMRKTKKKILPLPTNTTTKRKIRHPPRDRRLH
jgi:hypothetical protein